MELQIFGKNMEITSTIENYVRKKIGKLTRYLSNIAEAKVEISNENTRAPENRFTVQVTLNNTKGVLIRGEERGESVQAAIDAVAEVLARQIERYKGKLYNKGRGVSLARQAVAYEDFVDDEKTAVWPRIVKVKRFAVKPMSVDEAAEQMELLGHSFFLFINPVNGTLSLLYRRTDGNYGLIEPELA